MPAPTNPTKQSTPRTNASVPDNTPAKLTDLPFSSDIITLLLLGI